MNQKSPYFLFLFLCFSLNTLLNAQTQNDSLAKYSYEELKVLIDNTKFEEQELSKLYTKEYLRRAKLDNDKIKISRGYFYLIVYYNNRDVPLAIKYTDSIIDICKDCEHEKYPALAYYFKGYLLGLDSKSQKESLDSFLKALSILKKNKNFSLELDTRNAIMLAQSQWRSDKETLKLYEDQLNFISLNRGAIDEYEITYLSALNNLSQEYIYNKEYAKALDAIKKGIKVSKRHNSTFKYYEFVQLNAITNYYLKKYKKTIDSLHKISSFLNDNDKAVSYYYLGTSNNKLGKKSKGLNFFLKLDSMYEMTKNVYPKLRSSYEQIIDYYKEQGNQKKQLLYLNKLIEVDEKNFDNYEYVNTTINRKYEIPEAIAERRRILEQAKAKENAWKYSFGIISAILLAVIGFLVVVFRRQRYYKKRFENVMNISTPRNIQKTNPQVTKMSIERSRNASSERSKGIDVPQEIIESILNQLQKFEASQKFTKQVSLTDLAKNLKTNPKYLSKIINWHYQKNFSHYISELRIEYVISRLKEDSKFRNYTVKAIAKEAGFGNTESFSKAFHKSTGIKPSYFIKELEKRLES